MHFQCWSFCHQSQKYGHVPSTRHHLVSCGQLSAFTSGIKQCIFRRYLSVSFRHTYYGHILSFNNIFACLFDVNDFNPCSHKIERFIGSDLKNEFYCWMNFGITPKYYLSTPINWLVLFFFEMNDINLLTQHIMDYLSCLNDNIY